MGGTEVSGDGSHYQLTADERARALASAEALRDKLRSQQSLAALQQANDRRAARLRRGWYLIVAAFGCFAIFACLIVVALSLDWFPWWLMSIALSFEVGTFVYLRLSRVSR